MMTVIEKEKGLIMVLFIKINNYGLIICIYIVSF